MANPLGEITVNVECKLSVSDTTAYQCLHLLEIYCKENNYKIVREDEDAEDWFYEFKLK